MTPLIQAVTRVVISGSALHVNSASSAGPKRTTGSVPNSTHLKERYVVVVYEPVLLAVHFSYR